MYFKCVLNIIFTCILLFLGSLSFSNSELPTEINKFISKKEYYNKKVKHKFLRKYRFSLSSKCLYGISRSYWGIYIGKVTDYKFILIPTFMVDNCYSIQDFICTLKINKKFLYDYALGSHYFFGDFKHYYIMSDFTVDYVFYKNEIIYTSDGSLLAKLNCINDYNFIDYTFCLFYCKDVSCKNTEICYEDFDLVFRVIDYEDYWFLLKEDKLWAYSLSKQLLYTTEELVTRIIQHKEVE